MKYMALYHHNLCMQLWILGVLPWALSGGGGAGPGFLQEGTHAGPVVQVSGQGGISGLKEGLRGEAATAALVPRVLQEGCGQEGLVEVQAVGSLLH